MKKQRLLLLAFILSLSSTLSAQTHAITGTITDTTRRCGKRTRWPEPAASAG